MPFESDKTMFEVYRDTTYSGQFRVVYFTELSEHNKGVEINHALSGQHFLDGFLKNSSKEEAKRVIESLLDRMNSGEQIAASEFKAALAEHLTS